MPDRSHELSGNYPVVPAKSGLRQVHSVRIVVSEMYGPYRLTVPRKSSEREKVCVNVSVNKGEGVVKGRDFLTAAMSNAQYQGV